MARKTKKEAERTRQLILMSALDLIDERGYIGTKLVDVAERLNLTKGAVYWHFTSKSDMFLAMMDSMNEQIDQLLMPLILKTSNLEDIRTLLHAYIDIFVVNESLRKYLTVLMLRIEWTEDLKNALDVFEEQNKELARFCLKILKKEQRRGVVRKDISLEYAANGIVGVVDGLLMDSLSTARIIQREQICAIIDIYIDGMRAKR